jgi:hypothetical protein
MTLSAPLAVAQVGCSTNPRRLLVNWARHEEFKFRLKCLGPKHATRKRQRDAGLK